MEFEAKDKEQMVEDVTSTILESIPELDFSDGEPLRTIIEAIMEELDLQYWYMGQIYENSFIDTAADDDLTNLVKIMGMERVPAQYATGRVKFYRETPAASDYIIPIGTLVETLPNIDGEIIRYETTESVTLLTGQTEVYANVQSVEPGLISNTIANKINVINDPPIGIESVINTESIIGGEDEETDDNLKVRTIGKLEASGLGTINAITNKLSGVAGVKSVKVLDMARGIGTMDILVLGDVIPMASSKITELETVIEEIKAGGIDFKVIEPVTVPINVNVFLYIKDINIAQSSLDAASKAIDDYFNLLKIGDSFIVNQLSSKILASSDNIIDVIINSPTSNTTIDVNSIAILGTKLVER
jgi:uncharacterized phage protein gp47/JayE